MNLFVNMTVQENLAMGAYTITDKNLIQDRLEFVYSCFPAGGAAQPVGRHHERRRAQDAGHRPGHDAQPQADAGG
jgi:ABC-type branched-subunit amino acid transport system ATPase component